MAEKKLNKEIAVGGSSSPYLLVLLLQRRANIEHTELHDVIHVLCLWLSATNGPMHGTLRHIIRTVGSTLWYALHRSYIHISYILTKSTQLIPFGSAMAYVMAYDRALYTLC